MLLDHGLGDVHGHVGGRGVDQPVGKGVDGDGLLAVVQALGDGLLHGLEIVVVVVLGEIVVHGGQLLILDLVALDMEHHVLAGQVLGVIVLGEGQLQIPLLAGADADKLFLESGDEAAGAQHQVVALGRAAVKGDAVLGAGIVDVHGIAVLGGTVHADHAGVLLAQALDLAVDLLIGHVGGILFRFQALVLAQSRLGPHVGAEGQKSPLLVGDLGGGHRGTPHDAQLLLLYGEHESRAGGILDRVFIKHVLAVEALYDHAGRLALAEAGHLDAAAVLAVGGGDVLFKLRAGELDLEGHGIVFFTDVLDDHGVSPLYVSAFLLKELILQAVRLYQKNLRIAIIILLYMGKNRDDPRRSAGKVCLPLPR